MLVIVKNGIQIKIPKERFMSFQDGYDGVMVQCTDGTNIRFDLNPIPPALKAMTTMIHRAVLTSDVYFNFDKIVSDPSKALQIGTLPADIH